MNSSTKILVIHMKELIIGIVIAVALIIFTILAIAVFGSSSKESVKTTPNSADKTTSKSSGGSVANTYMPGVYTSSISVNGTPVEIQVTVDENNINAIELINLSDSVTTMYPMIQSSFDVIAEKVKNNGSTVNITYEAENKYTSAMMLQGIQTALDKCTIR